MKTLAMLFAFAAAMLAGCVTKHTGPQARDVEWKVGVTTRRAVVERWGNPDRLRGNEWTWKNLDSLGGKFKLAYMMIGFTASNSGVATRETRMTFDDHGVLQSVVTETSVPDGVKWSPFPW